MASKANKNKNKKSKEVDIVSGAEIKAPHKDEKQHDANVREIKEKARTADAVQVSQLVDSRGLVTLYVPEMKDGKEVKGKGEEKEFHPVDAVEHLRNGHARLTEKKEGK